MLPLDPFLPSPDPFSHRVPGVGLFSIRPLQAKDCDLLHRWVSEPRASFWGMVDASLDEVRQHYTEQMRSPHHAPCLGFFHGEPVFLLESYDPAHDEIGTLYPVQSGDRGMHVLLAPAAGPAIHGFSRAVMQTLMFYLFADPAVQRVVVEPDLRNERIHVLNRTVGFSYSHTLELSYKTAWLAFCTRQAFFDRMQNLEEIPA